jgi:hypothetical protein
MLAPGAAAPIPFAEYTMRPTRHWDRWWLIRLPYKEFLKTEFWREVRDEVKRRDHYRCALCASQAGLNVHHRTYEHHGFEDMWLRDLICLCRNCHAKFHDKLVEPGIFPLDVCAVVTPRPEDPKKVRTWIRQNVHALAVEALKKLLEYDPTCRALQDVPRLRTKLGEDMGINAQGAGLLIRYLGKVGILDNGFVEGPAFSRRFRQV